jgi:hypothetical protein
MGSQVTGGFWRGVGRKIGLSPYIPDTRLTSLLRGLTLYIR